MFFEILRTFEQHLDHEGFVNGCVHEIELLGELVQDSIEPVFILKSVVSGPLFRYDVHFLQGYLSVGGDQLALFEFETDLPFDPLDISRAGRARNQIPVAVVADPVGQAQILPGKGQVLWRQIVGPVFLFNGQRLDKGLGFFRTHLSEFLHWIPGITQGLGLGIRSGAVGLQFFECFLLGGSHKLDQLMSLEGRVRAVDPG